MWNTFIGKRLMGGKYAIIGALKLIKNEASIKVQVAMAIAITIAGFVFDISNTEWLVQVLTISLVLAAEGLNTAIEEIANFVHPDFHNKIGYIKDVAAGAVFFTALGAVIIACIIYIPKF